MRRRDEATRVHVKEREKGKKWAEGGVQREHMAFFGCEGREREPSWRGGGERRETGRPEVVKM